MTYSALTGNIGDTSEKARWELVDDFVVSINAHRVGRVMPSELLCVDESMSKWYGQGGHWIDRRLPHYVAIDRKPVNGCEIQNAAGARSGIMLELSIVTSAEFQRETEADESGDLPHGTVVLKRLVEQCAGTARIVCADSYFGSVASARELLAMGLRPIATVKTATREFPMQALSAMPLQEPGEHASFIQVNADGKTDMMAVLWVDRDRRYMIATASTTIPGEAYERVRWLEI